MSILAAAQHACVVAFVVLLAAAAWQDLQTMRIADGFSLGIVLCFILWGAFGFGLGGLSIADLGMRLACSICMFAIGGAAFAAGALGGGDVKLLSAATLFAGPGLVEDLVLVTALVGGGLAVAKLAGAFESPVPDADRSTGIGESLPYGPAIAAGGLWAALSLMIS